MDVFEQRKIMEADEIRQVRKEKLNELINKGIDPYGRRFQGSMPVKEVLDAFEEGKQAVVAGRVMANRKHGKVMFMDIRDRTDKMQVFIRKDNVGEDLFEVASLLDIGDIIGVEGELFITKTGERSLRVSGVTLLSKSLMCLPEKWHGLKDVEIRYRQRYLDLIANVDVRDVFIKRSQIVSYIRRYFDERGFLEVETPMLQPMPQAG